MDVKLFLEGQAKWEADSPHCLVVLHKMFQHASEQGQKEVEHMVCLGYWHRYPKLDPEVDVSTIQLVGPQTSRKEIESLYYEMYKLWRLPGSPPRELELIAEVVSSLEDCQGQEWRETPQTSGEPKSTGIQTPRNRTPRGRDASKKRNLAEVREAHHSALAAAATLEGEIKWLSCLLVWSQSETQTHFCSRNHHRHSSREQKRRHCQVWLEDCHAPYFEYNPPLGSSEPGGEEVATKDSDLVEPLELEPEVTYFLQRSPESLGKRTWRHPPPNPQYKSCRSGWPGRLKHAKHPAGGRS